MTEGRPMSRTMSTFLRDESGGAMILAAVILPIGLAAVGAAVTYSNVSATRVSYQKALDGAVLAGTILPGSASAAERIKAAEVVFAAGITGQVQSVTVASSTRFKVDTLGSDDVKVTGEASAEVKNLFGVIGGETIAIAVHSAGRKGQSDPVCLMALNGKDQGAVDLNGTVDVTTNCPVQANSSDGAAVRQVGNAAMTSSMFAVAGNYRGSNFSPKPLTGSDRVADPLASLPFPASGLCVDLGLSGSGKLQQETRTLLPGTYCGGLDITADSKIRLGRHRHRRHDRLHRQGREAVAHRRRRREADLTFVRPLHEHAVHGGPQQHRRQHLGVDRRRFEARLRRHHVFSKLEHLDLRRLRGDGALAEPDHGRRQAVVPGQQQDRRQAGERPRPAGQGNPPSEIRRQARRVAAPTPLPEETSAKGR